MIRLRMPCQIAYMISVGIRFVPMMVRDSLTALAPRGIVIEKLKLKNRLKVYTYLLLPIVAGSLHNARALSMSMEMRGFGAYPRRTSYFTLSLGRRDCFLLAVTFLLTILTIVIMASGIIS